MNDDDRQLMHEVADKHFAGTVGTVIHCLINEKPMGFIEQETDSSAADIKKLMARKKRLFKEQLKAAGFCLSYNPNEHRRRRPWKFIELGEFMARPRFEPRMSDDDFDELMDTPKVKERLEVRADYFYNVYKVFYHNDLEPEDLLAMFEMKIRSMPRMNAKGEKHKFQYYTGVSLDNFMADVLRVLINNRRFKDRSIEQIRHYVGELAFNSKCTRTVCVGCSDYEQCKTMIERYLKEKDAPLLFYKGKLLENPTDEFITKHEAEIEVYFKMNEYQEKEQKYIRIQ